MMKLMVLGDGFFVVVCDEVFGVFFIIFVTLRY